jgi:hypothetical protein
VLNWVDAKKIDKILHCICHCDDNCLVGRLETTKQFISFHSVASKALLALAVCLAGCDHKPGIYSKVSKNCLSQPYSDCPSVKSFSTVNRLEKCVVNKRE